MNKEIRSLLRLLERPCNQRKGWTVTFTSDQHYVVRLNKAYVTTLSSRPKDPKALKNSRHELSRAGFDFDT